MKHRRFIQFREAEKKDILDLIEVIRQGQLFGTSNQEVCKLENFENFIEIIKKNDNQFLYVVLEKEIIVATFQIFILFNFASGARPDIQIENFFVRESHRSLGIGKQVLDWIFDFAKSRNASRVQLTTNKKRFRAREFYLKNGFVDSHVGMKFYI